MAKGIMLTIALGVLLFSSPSYAECNSICRQKCAATAGRTGSTVRECIQLWSYINAKHGRGAARFEGGAHWTRGLCLRKCGIQWRRLGYASVGECARTVPCSNYPNE